MEHSELLIIPDHLSNLYQLYGISCGAMIAQNT